jgi:uncharacterized protein
MSVPYYYVYKDVASEWRWKFVSKNSKTIAVSSESYKNLADCEHGIHLIKTEGATAVTVGDDAYDRAKRGY